MDKDKIKKLEDAGYKVFDDPYELLDYIATCPACDTLNSIKEEIKLDRVELPNDVVLTPVIPVNVCSKCGYMYTDYRAEEIREEAVKQYKESLK